MIFAFLILVTSATTCGNVLFFQADERFSTENAKFWPILAILSQIYAHIGVFFAGLSKVANTRYRYLYLKRKTAPRSISHKDEFCSILKAVLTRNDIQYCCPSRGLYLALAFLHHIKPTRLLAHPYSGTSTRHLALSTHAK